MTETLAAGLLFLSPSSYLISLPYHTIFTILIGLFWLPRVLSEWSINKIIGLMIVAGLVYGLWSFAWSASIIGVAVSYFNYIPYIILSTVSLMVGYFFLGQGGGSLTKLRFTKFGFILASSFLLYTAYIHYWLFVIPVVVILAGVLICLWKFSYFKLGHDSKGQILEIKIPFNRLSLLLIFPIVASLSAWFYYAYLPDPATLPFFMAVPFCGYFYVKLFKILIKKKW